MSDEPVPRLAAVAREVLDALAAGGRPACLIGGLAVLRWGQQRATRDVDLTVLAPYGDEAPVLSLLLERFHPRRSDAREMAVANRVLLIASGSGVAIDVALASFPFELEAIERATRWEIVPGITVRTCSAEDLIVYKLVAARPQDLIDVEGVVRRQRERLDAGRIRSWALVFAELKEDPDLVRPFETAMSQARK